MVPSNFTVTALLDNVIIESFALTKNSVSDASVTTSFEYLVSWNCSNATSWFTGTSGVSFFKFAYTFK